MDAVPGLGVNWLAVLLGVLAAWLLACLVLAVLWLRLLLQDAPAEPAELPEREIALAVIRGYAQGGRR